MTTCPDWRAPSTFCLWLRAGPRRQEENKGAIQRKTAFDAGSLGIKKAARRALSALAFALCIGTGAPSPGADVPAGADHLFPIEVGGKYGYIDRTGKEVVEPQFLLAWESSEGLGLVDLRGTGPSCVHVWYGRAGIEWLTEARFDFAKEFREGLAGVCVGFRARPGRAVEWRNPKTGGLVSGHVWEFDWGKWGYIDRTGGYVIRPRFDLAQGFSEGLAAVRVGDKWGYVDRAGELVVKPQFDSAGQYSEGLARIGVGKKEPYAYGFIDRSGKVIINPQFAEAGDFRCGLCPVGVRDSREGLKRDEAPKEAKEPLRFGYINSVGRMLIGAAFEEASSFSGGLAAVRMKGKVGYIAPTGVLAIAPTFEDGLSFSDGLAAVRVDGKWGYIDRGGAFAIPARFDSAASFSQGLAAVTEQDRKGYINTRGAYVWRTQTVPQ
jgi:hypothetical protein